MVKIKQDSVGSDTRYYGKVKAKLLAQGYSDADASQQAFIQTINRAKGFGAIRPFKRIAERILVKHGINKVAWGQYYSCMNAFVYLLTKGREAELPLVHKKFLDRGLDMDVLKDFYAIFGDLEDISE